MTERRTAAETLDNITYVCLRAKHQGNWVLAHHKRRDSWEPAGGHVEPGETPLEAAVRELYEETGAVDFIITPAYDYGAITDDGILHNNGRTYYVEITRFSDLPPCSEMDAVAAFPIDAFPQDFTYDLAAIIDSALTAEQLASDRPAISYQNGKPT